MDKESLLTRIDDASEKMSCIGTPWDARWYFVTYKQFILLLTDPGVTFNDDGRICGVQIFVGEKEGWLPDQALVAVVSYTCFATYDKVLVRPWSE